MIEFSSKTAYDEKVEIALSLLLEVLTLNEISASVACGAAVNLLANLLVDGVTEESAIYILDELKTQVLKRINCR